MRRITKLLLQVTLIAAGLIWAGRAVDAQQKTSRAERLKTITADYEKKYTEFALAFQNARTDAERQQAEKRKPSDVDYGKRVLALVKEAPTDGVAFDGLVWAVENLDGPDSADQRDEALALFEKHHLKSPRLKSAISSLAECHCDKAEKLLEKLGAQGETPEIRGLALYHLAVARYERLDGKDERSYTAIETLLDRVQKEYGTVQPDDEDKTLARLAEGMLFEIRNLRPGKAVPDLAGTEVSGKALKLSSFRGKVVMLVFWGSWCGPCMAKVPFERKLMEKYQGRPFTVIGINCGDTKAKAAGTMKDQKMNWPSFFDGEDGPIVSRWNISSFPTVYLIDAKGVIRLKDPDDDGAMESLIAEAVAEAERK